MAKYRFYADLKVRGVVNADMPDEARVLAQDLLARWAQGQAGSVSVERVAVLAEPVNPFTERGLARGEPVGRSPERVNPVPEGA